jgi:hypothetical protein
MLFIFDDERHSHGRFASDPIRDGAFFRLGSVTSALCGTTTQRRTFLTQAKNCFRHDGVKPKGSS